MAARWQDIEAKKDRYHLQYRTAGDDRVREEHAEMHGITLPPDDPFWASYFPPNGWRCFPAGTKVLSFAGSWRNIEDIRVGDMVVGGSGQYQLVTAVHVRPFAGELVGIRSERSWTSCTPNHRVFTSMGWKEAGNLSVGDMLVQVGKIGFFHKAVNAIHNLYALCRYGCMSLVGKREASRALAVDGQRRAGKVEVDDVPSYPFPELEPNPLASKKLKENRFVAAGGKPQCRHPFRMPRTALQGMFQRFHLDFLPEKGRICLELVRHAAHHLAVALVHALPHMKAGKGQLVVDLRKQLPGRLSSFFRVNPLGLDRFAPMTDGKAGKGNQTGEHPVVCLPSGAQVPVTSLLADISQFHGIPEIHSFDGFHSFCYFLKRTFFHCRYVLVTGKDRVKADTVVYNLSVDNDESYVVPCGIVHNCRCTAVQVNKGKYPLSDSKEAGRKGEKATTRLDRFGNNKDAIFRFNPGIDERLFPPKHPYLPKGCGDCRKGVRNLAYDPDSEQCRACLTLAKLATKQKISPQEKDAIYALPLDKQFRKVYTDKESGHSVLQHRLVDETGEDYRQVLAVAKAYAKDGDCKINPIVAPKAEKGRQKIYPGIKDNANPDLTTVYGHVDVKSPHRKNNIVSNANDACKQGAIAVITDLALDEPLTLEKAQAVTLDIFSKRNANQKGIENYTKDVIHWFIGGKLHKLNRPEKK